MWFLRHRPGVALSIVYLLLVAIAAIFGTYFFAESAGAVNFATRNLPPLSVEAGWNFVLGSDSLGRPTLDRLLAAAQPTVGITLIAVAIGAAIGISLGLVAGMREGPLTAIIMRFTDALMSFPTLLLAILLLYVVKSSIGTVIVVLAVSRVALFIRVTRAETMEIRSRVYVTASRAIGAPVSWITRVHLLPTLLPTLVTLLAVEVAFTMLAESSLSFIGVGVQSPGVSWGLMVAQGRDYLATQWWLAFWPGLAIVLTAMSLIVLADWLKTALDPRQKWRLQSLESTK
ncbi:MAG: ABC transporter permease [Pelagibacterium sp. SCN 63-23]|nr:MAG: ABC transporter permease [Pelagibacterium sp. SCN 63-23]